MPWIAAGATLVGGLLSSQQAAGGQRAQATQGQQAKSQAQPFTPTAGASQGALQNAAPTEAMDLASGGPTQARTPPPPAGGGGSNVLGNANQAIQAGATLSQLFQNDAAMGQNARAQALAGRPQASMAPYQPTATRQMDPRLQQLLGR